MSAVAMEKRDQEKVRAPAQYGEASVRALSPDGQRCACDEAGAAETMAGARAWAMRMQASRRALMAENARLRGALDAAAVRLEAIDAILWEKLADLHQAIEGDDYADERVLQVIGSMRELFDTAQAQIDDARAGADVQPVEKGP